MQRNSKNNAESAGTIFIKSRATTLELYIVPSFPPTLVYAMNVFLHGIACVHSLLCLKNALSYKVLRFTLPHASGISCKRSEPNLTKWRLEAKQSQRLLLGERRAAADRQTHKIAN